MTLVLTWTVNFKWLASVHCPIILSFYSPFSSPHTFNHLPLFAIYVQQWRFGFPIHYILRKQFLYLDLIFDYIFQYDKANFGCKCTHRGRERWETNYFTSKLWTLILFNSYVFFSNYFIMFFCTENYLKML